MSGPIVRTGATPEFSEGWDRIFGGKQGREQPAGRSTKKKAATPSAKPAAAKSTKKASAKKAAKKK